MKREVKAALVSLLGVDLADEFERVADETNAEIKARGLITRSLSRTKVQRVLPGSQPGRRVIRVVYAPKGTKRADSRLAEIQKTGLPGSMTGTPPTPKRKPQAMPESMKRHPQALNPATTDLNGVAQTTLTTMRSGLAYLTRRPMGEMPVAMPKGFKFPVIK